MTQEPKKYTHHILNWKAESQPEHFKDNNHPYRILVGDGLDDKDTMRYSQKEIEALGFVELPTTDTGKGKEDWTDEEIKQWVNNVRGGTEEGRAYAEKTIKGFLTFYGIHKDSYMKASEMPKPVEPVLIPVTSTIEEQINQIENIIRNGGWAYGADILTVKGEKGLKQLLSSLSPIQKKRTREYVWDSMKGLPCVTAFMINQTYKFLEKEGMLQE